MTLCLSLSLRRFTLLTCLGLVGELLMTSGSFASSTVDLKPGDAKLIAERLSRTALGQVLIEHHKRSPKTMAEWQEILPKTPLEWREVFEKTNAMTDVLVPFSDAPGYTDLDQTRAIFAINTFNRGDQSLDRVNYTGKLFLGIIVHENGDVECEFISWNRQTRSFDFGIIKNLSPVTGVAHVTKKSLPEVNFPETSACFSCHKNQGPIFPTAPWGNTTANMSTWAALVEKLSTKDPELKADFEAAELHAKDELENRLTDIEVRRNTKRTAVIRAITSPENRSKWPTLSNYILPNGGTLMRKFVLDFFNFDFSLRRANDSLFIHRVLSEVKKSNLQLAQNTAYDYTRYVILQNMNNLYQTTYDRYFQRQGGLRSVFQSLNYHLDLERSAIESTFEITDRNELRSYNPVSGLEQTRSFASMESPDFILFGFYKNKFFPELSEQPAKDWVFKYNDLRKIQRANNEPFLPAEFRPIADSAYLNVKRSFAFIKATLFFGVVTGEENVSEQGIKNAFIDPNVATLPGGSLNDINARLELHTAVLTTERRLRLEGIEHEGSPEINAFFMKVKELSGSQDWPEDVHVILGSKEFQKIFAGGTLLHRDELMNGLYNAMRKHFKKETDAEIFAPVKRNLAELSDDKAWFDAIRSTETFTHPCLPCHSNTTNSATATTALDGVGGYLGVDDPIDRNSFTGQIEKEKPELRRNICDYLEQGIMPPEDASSHVVLWQTKKTPALMENLCGDFKQGTKK